MSQCVRSDPTVAVLDHRRRLAWMLALLVPLVLGLIGAAAMGSLRPLNCVTHLYASVLLLLLGVCTYTDLTEKRIPNWATYTAFLWALLLNGFVSLSSKTAVFGEADGLLEQGTPPYLGAVGLGPCLAGALVCFLVLFFIYRLAGGGAGDVKLATTLGALLGLERGLNVLVVSYVLAGVTIVCWIIWTIGPVILTKALLRKAGSLLFPLWVMPPTMEQNTLLKRPVPLAVFFALGTLAVVGGLTIPW